jgi:hypothetical protein
MLEHHQLQQRLLGEITLLQRVLEIKKQQLALQDEIHKLVQPEKYEVKFKPRESVAMPVENKKAEVSYCFKSLSRTLLNANPQNKWSRFEDMAESLAISKAALAQRVTYMKNAKKDPDIFERDNFWPPGYRLSAEALEAARK